MAHPSTSQVQVVVETDSVWQQEKSSCTCASCFNTCIASLSYSMHIHIALLLNNKSNIAILFNISPPFSNRVTLFLQLCTRRSFFFFFFSI